MTVACRLWYPDTGDEEELDLRGIADEEIGLLPHSNSLFVNTLPNTASQASPGLHEQVSKLYCMVSSMACSSISLLVCV